MWSIYLLRDAAGSLYTGISTDVRRRCLEHQNGGGRSGKYTRSRKELTLVYSCPVGSRSAALQAEYRLKRLRKKEKEAIVLAVCDRQVLLKRLGLTVPAEAAAPPEPVSEQS